MTISLAGCGTAPTQNSSDKLSIIGVNFPAYDFARQVAGDKAQISMLLPPASESHSYEPTPQDIIKIQECDIFIYGGGESDTWVSGVLESIDTSAKSVIKMLDCVTPVEEEIVEGMQDEEEEGESAYVPVEDGIAATEEDEEEEPEYDEHVWTNPQNVQLIARKIADELRVRDSGNADTYQKNLSDFNAELIKLDAEFEQVVASGKRKTIVFGDRFPFRYFADRYDLTYFAAFPGCSTETEASAQTVSFLIDKVKAERIPVIFHIELSNKKMATAIAEQTGAKVLELHASHNVSKADFESGKSYLDIMRTNISALKEALN
jgi:zinc transport system substrate-binding protein